MQRCSTIDFPGTLSCVLFTRGCNLNCFYCHNRALLRCNGPSISEEEVWAFLKKRQGLLDGVVVSGGEPTLQEDLLQFLRRVRSMGFHTKLDTNGQRPKVLLDLLAENMLSYVALDYKAPEEAYGWVAESREGFAHVRENVEALLASSVLFEVRTTLYPGLSGQELLEMLGTIPPVPVYRLNFFGMPKEYRKQDTLLFRRNALQEADIACLLPEMKKLQPNIAYGAI